MRRLLSGEEYVSLAARGRARAIHEIAGPGKGPHLTKPTIAIR